MPRGASESQRLQKETSSSFCSDTHLPYAESFAAEMSIFRRDKVHIRIKVIGCKASQFEAS